MLFLCGYAYIIIKFKEFKNHFICRSVIFYLSTRKSACYAGKLVKSMNYKNEEVRAYRKQFLEATGKVISKNRKKKNITQEELGRVLDVSGTTVGRYEKGAIEIPVSSLPLASNACDFPLRDYLIEWENINVESTVRKALSGKRIEPNDTEIKYIVDNCTEEEADEILTVGLWVQMTSVEEYKKGMLEVMIERHITHKREEEMYKRMMLYYKKLTGKNLLWKSSDFIDKTNG